MPATVGTSTPADDQGAELIAEQMASILRNRRRTLAISLDQAASMTGVSRSALSQIETKHCNPSLSVLWKISAGLGIPLAEIISPHDREIHHLHGGPSQAVLTGNGHIERRRLIPEGVFPWAEIYELRIVPHGRYASEPHLAWSREIVVPINLPITIRIGDRTFEVAPGDSLTFSADTIHAYENPNDLELRAHNIVLYSR